MNKDSIRETVDYYREYIPGNIPEDKQILLDIVKSNGMSGCHINTEVYTQNVLETAWHLMLQYIVAIVPVNIQGCKTPEEFKELYDYAQTQDNWHTIIIDSLEDVFTKNTEWYVIVITTLNNRLADNDNMKHIVKMAMTADHECNT